MNLCYRVRWVFLWSAIILSTLACTVIISNVSLTPTTQPPTIQPRVTLTSTEPALSFSPSPQHTLDEGIEEVPTVAPTPDLTNDLKVTSVRGYITHQGSLEVVGLVNNQSDIGVSFVQLEVEGFDSAGNSLFKENAFAIMEYLAPGEASPFMLYIADGSLPVQDYHVAVVGYHPDVIERATVNIAHERMVIDDHGDIFIVGSLINQNDFPVIVNSLGVATFDSVGQIITANAHSVLMRYLAPGQVGFFRVMMNGPRDGTSQISRSVVYIDAQRSEPQPEIPFTIVASRDYLDTFGSFHLVGEVTNRSESHYKVNLLAAIYDSNGEVIDASDLGLPFAVIAPGESVPFDFSHWGPLNTKEGLLVTAEHFVVYIDYYWTWIPTSEVIELPLEDQREDFGDDEATFSGKVVNNAGSPLSSATIVVALKDIQENKIMATNYDFIYEEMLVGAAYDYIVTIPLWEGFERNALQVIYLSRGTP